MVAVRACAVSARGDAPGTRRRTPQASARVPVMLQSQLGSCLLATPLLRTTPRLRASPADQILPPAALPAAGEAGSQRAGRPRAAAPRVPGSPAARPAAQPAVNVPHPGVWAAGAAAQQPARRADDAGALREAGPAAAPGAQLDSGEERAQGRPGRPHAPALARACMRHAPCAHEPAIQLRVQTHVLRCGAPQVNLARQAVTALRGQKPKQGQAGNGMLGGCH